MTFWDWGQVQIAISLAHMQLPITAKAYRDAAKHQQTEIYSFKPIWFS